jgi:spore maturation protein CgeB
MRVLSIGSFQKKSNTCLHRHKVLTSIYKDVYKVELYSGKRSLYFKLANFLFQKFFLPFPLPDENGANKLIKRYINESRFDIIWVDKGLTIKASTLLYIKKKQPNVKIVSFTLDNMVERHNQSSNFLKSIGLYDYHITTKSYIINNLRNLGAKNVIFTNQSFDSSFHYPRILDKEELESFGGDIGFIGMWEKQRCDSILYLVNNGLKVKVYGGGVWKKYINYHPNLTIKPSVFSENYPKCLQSFKISLCFLRKMNSDLQTSRTMEIPACGGFMMAERTKEHLELFVEGKEADFFSTDKELLDKCKYYLKNEKLRIEISKAALNRCNKSGYSNIDSLKKIISQIK